MSTALHDQKLTYAEYLAWENDQADRHEFIGGRIFAMTGAIQKHNLVVTNVGFALRRGLQGTPAAGGGCTGRPAGTRLDRRRAVIRRTVRRHRLSWPSAALWLAPSGAATESGPAAPLP